MAAPTVVAGATIGQYVTSGTSRVINAPGHAAGDMLYIAYASDGDSDTASVSGFSVVYGPVSLESGGGVFYLWKKVAGSSEPASYTIINTVSERACAVAFAVRNDNGVNATGTNSSGTGTAATVPAVTSTVADTLRVSLLTSNKDIGPVSTGTGLTLVATARASSGGTISVQTKALPTATTDGSVSITATGGTGQAFVGMTFAIAPTASGVILSPGAAIAVGSAVGPTIATSAPTAPLTLPARSRALTLPDIGG